ncbi:MAG: methyltransferase [Planctomycetota bacterium]|jgi:16S rRNA G1207 methylase RsmC
MSRRHKARRFTAEEPLGDRLENPQLETPAVESLLAECRFTPGRLVGTLTVGRGQLARQLAARLPESRVECLVLDSFQAELVRGAGELPENLQVLCAADWSPQPFDQIFAPLRRRESAELNRDLLQSAFLRLRPGGELFVGVDSPDHPALLTELRQWNKSVEQAGDRRGRCFRLRKEAELRRVREFSAEIVFRDRDRLLKLRTRPGVFAHRQLDAGARQILKGVDAIPGRRVLDIGCGSGVIAVALAARDRELEVWAVDSHARAVEATTWAANENQLPNLRAVLSHTAEVPGLGTFDLVTANPPYFADFEIAERFLDGAVRALRPEGVCWLVTKLPNWYREHAGRWLREVEVWSSGDYHLVRGIR